MGSASSAASTTFLEDGEERNAKQENINTTKSSLDETNLKEEHHSHACISRTSIDSNNSDVNATILSKRTSEESSLDSDTDISIDSDSEDDFVTVTVDYNAFKEETFERLKMSAKVLHDTRSEISAKDNRVQELIFIYKLYFDVEKKGFERPLYEKYQKELCNVLLQLDVLNMLTEILEGVTKDADVDAVTNEHIQVMRLVMGILHNCTDISDEFAIAVAKTKVLEMTKNILDTNSNNNNQNDRLEAVITNCHGIAHNVSMREKNVERLRNLDFVTTVAPYLKSKEAMIRISALATLANIVTEKECLIIGNHILVVAQLLMLLNEGMATESRRCNGWSCKECALAIRQLARNDANKQLLNELKALQSLIELAKSKDKEEQIESLLAILALSFNDNIRADMTKTSELGVVDLLLDLKESSDDQKIKSACEKTLWNLKDDLLLSPIPSYKKAGERMQKKNDPDTNTGHIMISYQRNDRKFLLTIRDKLKDSGFKVWMDVDKMGGCVYETMADAVENASIFLMCYSRKYKESDNCQYEAKYAHKKKKTVIPLKMERDYDPDGWLGLLLKSDYFLEFSGKYDTEDKFKELLARIKTLWSHGQDIVDTPVIEKEQQPVLAKTIDEVDAPPKIGPNKFEERRNIPYSARINIIKGWNQQDINKWLESNNLKNQGIDKITALEISLMARMLIEVPEQLYECLRQDLKIKTLSTKAKIVWALDDLVHTEDDKL